MPESSVTVIVVDWNGGDMLIECLSRLTAQSVPPSRILVMDNGSTDGSARRAAVVPGVDVRYLGANLGFAAAVNRALEECDTEFVALLNPDAFPDTGWLKSLLLAAGTEPGVAALGSCQLIYGSHGIVDGVGDVYHLSGLVWRSGHGHVRSEVYDVNSEIFSPCAAAALYRRAALVELGGFDEDYFCYLEDVDLGFRLRLAGYRSIYVADAVVHHVGSATTGGQRSDFAVYHGHRNLVWTYIKNMPPSLFWLLLPLHLFMNIATIVYLTLRGQGKVILVAKLDAVKGISQAWRKRKSIQSDRRARTSDIWHLLDKRLYPSRKISGIGL